jgi:hypothetical protein
MPIETETMPQASPAPPNPQAMPEVDPDTGERPPLGSWRLLYALVIGELVLLILLFTLFARAFR